MAKVLLQLSSFPIKKNFSHDLPACLNKTKQIYYCKLCWSKKLSSFLQKRVWHYLSHFDSVHSDLYLCSERLCEKQVKLQENTIAATTLRPSTFKCLYVYGLNSRILNSNSCKYLKVILKFLGLKFPGSEAFFSVTNMHVQWTENWCSVNLSHSLIDQTINF